MPNDSRIILQWRAPEFIKQEKTVLWDISVFGVAGLLLIWGLIRGDVTLVALSIFGGFVFWTFGKKEPRVIEFALREDGIQIDHSLYRYDRLESFWLIEDETGVNSSELLFHSKALLMPYVHVNLGDLEVERVREILTRFIPEQKDRLPLSHLISKLLGY